MDFAQELIIREQGKACKVITSDVKDTTIRKKENEIKEKNNNDTVLQNINKIYM